MAGRRTKHQNHLTVVSHPRSVCARERKREKDEATARSFFGQDSCVLSVRIDDDGDYNSAILKEQEEEEVVSRESVNGDDASISVTISCSTPNVKPTKTTDEIEKGDVDRYRDY